VLITRRWAAALVGVGVWTWLTWPRFALAIWDDKRAFSNGTPTAFLWVHAVLIVASLAIGTMVGVLGVRALHASRRQTAATDAVANPTADRNAGHAAGRAAERNEGTGAAAPQD
jgi:ABC-type Mn2+/Zn2+ transport system permease subunit